MNWLIPRRFYMGYVKSLFRGCYSCFETTLLEHLSDIFSKCLKKVALKSMSNLIYFFSGLTEVVGGGYLNISLAGTDDSAISTRCGQKR